MAWGKFLAAAADEDLEALALEYPVMKQAKDALELLSADSEARIRAEQRENALFFYEYGLAKAHREGKAELLLRQLTLKFGDLPAAVASQVENATVVQLLRWSERILSAESLDAVFKG